MRAVLAARAVVDLDSVAASVFVGITLSRSQDRRCGRVPRGKTPGSLHGKRVLNRPDATPTVASDPVFLKEKTAWHREL
ncbi:hypothetical protein GCM10027047_36000 [Rhodococcus aerolatus]